MACGLRRYSFGYLSRRCRKSNIEAGPVVMERPAANRTEMHRLSVALGRRQIDDHDTGDDSTGDTDSDTSSE
jgi:hypothetical protein